MTTVIDGLSCPYCGSQFQPNLAVVAAPYYVLTCECGEFPVVDGIPRLIADALSAAAVRCIRRADFGSALGVLLEWPSFSSAGTLVRRATRLLATRDGSALALGLAIKKRLIDVFQSTELTFCGLVERLDAGLWGEWLRFRFSMEPLLPLYSLRELAATEGLVLDLGCGVGHSSFLLSARLPAKRLVCMDSTFPFLYLARKYFVPEAYFVCLDASAPLPFADAAFSRVFACDAFHFLTGKRMLAGELARVLDPHGIVVLSHVHNRRYPSPYAGRPLEPEAYLRLFADLTAHLFRSDEIVRRLVREDMLDLSRGDSIESANTQSSFSLVAARDASAFRRYEGIWSAAASGAGNLTVNPLYRLEEKEGRARLQRRRLSASFAPLAQATSIDLPDMVELSAGPVARKGASDLEALKLAQRFLMLELPANFGQPT